jgi:hypothetical protein
MVIKFFNDVLKSFYPPSYKELKNNGFVKGYSFLLKVLFLALIIAGLILLPKYINLKTEITEDLSKIHLNISGDLETDEKISIPSRDPLLSIDRNSNIGMDKELFVINKDEFQFRFFGKRKIEIEKLKNFSEHKDEVGTFLTSMFILLFPGLFFIIFIKSAIKYLIISLFLGLIAFLLIDLTNYKLKFKKILSISAYTGAPIILAELIISAINPKILFPFIRFIGLNVYSVTLIIWFFFIILCIIVSNKKTKNE